MNNLLFFILGLIIGGLGMTTLMSLLQVKKVNEYERRLYQEEQEE